MIEREVEVFGWCEERSRSKELPKVGNESMLYSSFPPCFPVKDYPVYLVLAEGVSALKNTFVRVLFILVSLGYGTVM